MKKGLLLSVVASGILFAGGNIAPVAPVAPAAPAAAPAACDFWGSIAFRYDAQKLGAKNDDWKLDSVSKLAVDLGVERELGYGFGIGAEVGALRTMNYKLQGAVETAELSQLYLTYKTGNTAFKFGRQALPKAVSPWAWSDRTAGILDNTFEALTVVNTDIANTTLVGAWVARSVDGTTKTKINGSNKGLFMLTGIYTGVANTTLSGSVYFMPKNGSNGKALSVWASATTKIDSFDLGLQAAYAKADAGSDALLGTATGTKKTFGIAAYAGTNYNGFDAKLTLAFINDGDATLNLGGTSAFWGDTFGSVFGGNADTAAGKQKIARLDLGYKPSFGGKIYGGVAADKPDNGKTAVAARVGYDFTVANVAAKVEYRYHKDFAGAKNHRVRVQGVYKF